MQGVTEGERRKENVENCVREKEVKDQEIFIVVCK